MVRQLYYVPKLGIRNKADTATVTIDWYKKKFRLPLNLEYFRVIPFEDVDGYIPQLKSTVSIKIVEYSFNIDLQGVAESIIYDKQNENEFVHILINEFK